MRSLEMFSQGFAIPQIYFIQVTKLTRNFMTLLAQAPVCEHRMHTTLARGPRIKQL